MTDLEITKLCAEAMGICVVLTQPNYTTAKLIIFQATEHDPSDGPTSMRGLNLGIYDPLTDDAQAMALVKKFAITTLPHHGKWSAVCAFMGSGQHVDLNRAICECVAKMQAAKGTA